MSLLSPPSSTVVATSHHSILADTLELLVVSSNGRAANDLVDKLVQSDTNGCGVLADDDGGARFDYRGHEVRLTCVVKDPAATPTAAAVPKLNCDILVLVFDVTDPSSCEPLAQLARQHLRRNSLMHSVIIAGMGCDGAERFDDAVLFNAERTIMEVCAADIVQRTVFVGANDSPEWVAEAVFAQGVGTVVVSCTRECNRGSVRLPKPHCNGIAVVPLPAVEEQAILEYMQRLVKPMERHFGRVFQRQRVHRRVNNEAGYDSDGPLCPDEDLHGHEKCA